MANKTNLEELIQAREGMMNAINSLIDILEKFDSIEIKLKKIA